MQRDLAGLERSAFDLAIIGGGIIGASIARDAARRGLSVALIEKYDFGSAASEAMSRTIHGGLRYLAQRRFDLVREALAERAVWLRTAPGFVSPQQFVLPLSGRLSGYKAKAAIAIYERFDGKRADVLTRAEALKSEPVLDMPGLSGAVAYHDARIDEPHQLILALMEDAATHGCKLANHCECMSLRVSGGMVEGLSAKDALSGESIEIRTASIVNATGPWAQRLAGTLLPGQRTAKLTASKGVHILTRAMTNGRAIALSGKGEHGFVLPWMGMSLVGTTDETCEAPNGVIEPKAAELHRLADKITRLLPGAGSFLESPLGSYAGIRALPGIVGDTYSASRETAICDHARDGAAGLLSVFGGKWTTARRIAETVVDLLAARAGRSLKPCDTRTAEITRPKIAATVEAAIQTAQATEMAITAGDVWRRLGRQILFAHESTRNEAAHQIAALRLPSGAHHRGELSA